MLRINKNTHFYSARLLLVAFFFFFGPLKLDQVVKTTWKPGEYLSLAYASTSKLRPRLEFALAWLFQSS
jgi:hypothetical protein